MSDAIPPPPYQLRGCSFLMVGAEFDPVAISKLIPPELEIADEATGGFYVYTAPRGWGIAPYSASLAWVDVKGHDSADGSHGRYMLFGAYSGTAFRAFDYNAVVIEGYGEITLAGDVLKGVGGPTGLCYIQLGVKNTSDDSIESDGTHYYIAPMSTGGLCSIPAAFSYDFKAAVPDYVEISAPPETLLGQMRPTRLTWAGWLTDGVITIGQPSPILDRSDTENTMSAARYLNFLTQVGRAAIAVKNNDTVVFQNEAAEKLAGDGFWLEQRKFRVSEENSTAWASAKSNAQTAGANWWERKPIGIARREARTPLIAQIVPYQDLLVVLITDAERGSEREPHQALQILGLTPAEARIGTLIGTGLEAQAVADRLAVSVSTVRSTMRLIYDKLGIRKQSQLSNLVARLASIGI